MDPAAWGPSAWRTVHTLAQAVDEAGTREAEDAFSDLMTGLSLCLPCRYCRTSFQHFLGAMQPARPHAHWAWVLHNAVNLKLGKVAHPRETVPRVCAERDVWLLLMAMAVNEDHNSEPERERGYDTMVGALSRLSAMGVAPTGIGYATRRALAGATNRRRGEAMVAWLLTALQSRAVVGAPGAVLDAPVCPGDPIEGMRGLLRAYGHGGLARSQADRQ